jgi:hypothetical protein
MCLQSTLFLQIRLACYHWRSTSSKYDLSFLPESCIHGIQGCAGEPSCFVVGRQFFNQELELVLPLYRRGCEQIPNDFEHADDMSFFLWAEFCDQQDGCGEKSLSGIVKEGVLPVIA